MATAMTTERLAELKDLARRRFAVCQEPSDERILELVAEVERLRSLGENRDRVYDAAVKDQADSR
jgi:hypothetical protein